MARGSSKLDVVIIGAGAAGLAAARELHEQGLGIAVLEARERIGGRVWTHQDRRTPAPIELGAEFIHGSAEETEKLLTEARLPTVDMAGKRFIAGPKTIRPLDDFWEQLYRAMHPLEKLKGRDRSFQEFLDTRPGGRRLAQERRLAKQFVEGFHAADPRLISTRALADSGAPGEDMKESRLARIVGGYAQLLDWMAAPVADRIRLGSIVTRVQWDEGRVTIDVKQADGQPRFAVQARAAIVTVPVGVLQAAGGEAGAIEFDPDLGPAKRGALACIASGTVSKVVMHLRERFWAPDDLSFLHSYDRDFQVWWTAYPLRAPVVVGWRGGPGAKRLSQLAPDVLEATAIASLARNLHTTPQRIRGMVEGIWSHDWEHDPFARGAYSYQMVGGADATAVLARPLRRTLFFAGEATGSDGSTGTVDGAIATGRRAARQITRVLFK